MRRFDVDFEGQRFDYQYGDFYDADEVDAIILSAWGSLYDAQTLIVDLENDLFSVTCHCSMDLTEPAKEDCPICWR